MVVPHDMQHSSCSCLPVAGSINQWSSDQSSDRTRTEPTCLSTRTGGRPGMERRKEGTMTCWSAGGRFSITSHQAAADADPAQPRNFPCLLSRTVPRISSKKMLEAWNQTPAWSQRPRYILPHTYATTLHSLILLYELLLSCRLSLEKATGVTTEQVVSVCSWCLAQ
jgi:hypothetical protein